uniref:Protein Wnt n=1 Tax=Macrostomum lignano TaxID=282301 RepID=A0A1I8FQ14_9PLAT
MPTESGGGRDGRPTTLDSGAMLKFLSHAPEDLCSNSANFAANRWLARYCGGGGGGAAAAVWRSAWFTPVLLNGHRICQMMFKNERWNCTFQHQFLNTGQFRVGHHSQQGGRRARDGLPSRPAGPGVPVLQPACRQRGSAAEVAVAAAVQLTSPLSLLDRRRSSARWIRRLSGRSTASRPSPPATTTSAWRAGGSVRLAPSPRRSASRRQLRLLNFDLGTGPQPPGEEAAAGLLRSSRRTSASRAGRNGFHGVSGTHLQQQSGLERAGLLRPPVLRLEPATRPGANCSMLYNPIRVHCERCVKVKEMHRCREGDWLEGIASA